MDTDILTAANDIAQLRFREMVEADVYGEPDHPWTKRYVEAERLVDAILAELQAKSLAAGDHHFQTEPAS